MLFDFQFSKEQNDSENNLYFLRARYYDPSIGRFISKDPVKGPLTNPQSQNPYAYSLNNPINLSMHGDSGDDILRASGVASYANGGANTDTCEAGTTVNCEVVITPTPTP